jgi:hypothetical protein
MASVAIRTPRQNHLLAALPAGIYQRLAPDLEHVALVRSSVIYEPGADLEFAYFPTSSIVSILNPLEDGAAAGLITYWRGCVTVVDRPGLEARVCECYAVVKTEIARLLPMNPRPDDAPGSRAAGGKMKPPVAATPTRRVETG